MSNIYSVMKERINSMISQIERNNVISFSTSKLKTKSSPLTEKIQQYVT